MNKVTPRRNQRAKPVTPLPDDALLEAGRAALVGKLGVSGTLRFLRLLGGGRDRWDDLRRAWGDVPMDELEAQMRREGLLDESV